jgi:hypothetical protein
LPSPRGVWLCWAARCGGGGNGTRAAPTGKRGWWWCVWAVGCWAMGAGLDRYGGGCGCDVIGWDCCGIEATATMVDESLWWYWRWRSRMEWRLSCLKRERKWFGWKKREII